MKKSGTIVAASLLSADYARFADEAADVERAGSDWHHVDIMDGHFVPNMTFGPGLVKALKSRVKLPLDVHLMIQYPEKWVDRYLEAGADILTIHVESLGDPRAAFRRIKESGRAKAGVTLNPDTPFERLEPYLPEADLILVMSVFPGFGGQSFMPETLDKVRRAAKARPDAWIEIDGGINDETAPRAVAAGANVLVAGYYVYTHKDRALAIRTLRTAGSKKG